MPAILFGSIGTIADTSELQRKSFNDAFNVHGLDWHWSQDDYQVLLQQGGGAQRVAQYADSLGQSVDAAAVHQSKSEIFQQALADAAPLSARPGVVQTIRSAKDQGFKVALVTTTSPANIAALLAALSPGIRADDFDLVVDSTQVQDSKPDPRAYALALNTLAEQADDCVAIEDNLTGMQAAQAAGLTCVAFPGTNNAGHDFTAAHRVVDHLNLDELEQDIPSANTSSGSHR